MPGRVLVAVLIFLMTGAAEAETLQVRIDQGDLSGVSEDAVVTFKNIPYAAPPVGPLRWRAPQPAPPWTGLRDGAQFGPACPQIQRGGDAFRVTLPTSEDCLTLNVWTPNMKPGAKLPVMVWIHGGAFLNGSAALPLYDGTDLAEHGVVVVSINYRLGALGFLAHRAFENENPGEAGGNFGLLDQIAALQWVQKNIAAFGGDAANVTIFGESAGGVSVNDLMTSPLARGLFAKAIAESGLGLEQRQSLAEAETTGAAFAARLGATGDDTQVRAKLRSLSADAIVSAQGSGERAVSPFIDGKVIPQDVSLAFARGDIAKVPYIAGSNSDEATLAPMIGLHPDAITKRFGDKVAAVRAIYERDGKISDDEFARQVFNDALFASGVQGLAGFAAKTGSPARAYQFAYVATYFRGRVAGVGHGGELVFVFGLRGLGALGSRASDADRAVIAMMQDYWTNFAKTGDPNGAGLASWPLFTPASQQTLVFDDQTKAVADFRKAQIGVMLVGWSMRTGLAAP